MKPEKNPSPYKTKLLNKWNQKNKQTKKNMSKKPKFLKNFYIYNNCVLYEIHFF